MKPNQPRRWDPLGRAASWRSGRFALLLKRSGRIGNPVALARRSVSGGVKGAVVAVPVAVLGAAYSPWALLLLLAPAVLFFLPEVKLRDEVAARQEGVERELPFFSVLVGVLGGAGVPLYTVLTDMAGSEVFPSLRKEAALVKRDVGIFGMNPNESFERIAANHPSKRFSGFLLGYTSKARSGGDVPAYLSAESGTFLRELEDSWIRYVARVGIVGSMMVTVFGVVPLLLMVVGVFSPGFSVFGLAAFTGVGVPLFTLALLYMTSRMQPAGEVPPRGRAPRALALALPGAAAGVLLGQAWAAAAGSLFAFFVVYGVSIRGQLAETRAMDEGVSRFLRDMLEYKRQDYDLARATIAIEAQGGYDPRFGRVLAKIATRLKAGVPLDEVKFEGRSRVGKLAFLLLGEMSRSGGGTVDTMFQVSNFADRMIQMRKNAAAEMKPYLVLSYISPLLLAFGVAFVSGVLDTLRQARPAFEGVHLAGLQVGAVPPGLTEISELLIVVSAASLGLIGAKITDFTVKNTVRAAVNVALAVGAVALMQGLSSHSLPGLLLR
ncbi:MAG: type II secretion system F family protein [Nitrososphaerota archaeon]|nr:type II secretion system F family protein [Nitrososphaerota archaeon]